MVEPVNAGSEPPLAGIRVVEISMYVQGPTAGLALASLGADVVKIEQTDHADLMRSLQAFFGVDLDERGQEWVYAALNRGKRSLAMDVTSEEGKPVFRELIERADVFVTNIRDEGLQRIGADPETLRQINPSLVYGRGGGFAMRGELAHDPCQDTVGMAYGGFMDLTSKDGEPNYPPGALSDVLTGTNLASAILAGLVKRSLTGQGSVVGTTQVQSLLWLQILPISMAASLGETPQRFDATAPPNPLFNPYPTKDGWISIAAIQDRQWPAIAEALDLVELMNNDPRFKGIGSMGRARSEVVPILTEKFRERTTHEWWAILRKAGVWVSPVHTMSDLAADSHVRDNDYLVEFPDGFTGPPAPFEVGDWHGARHSASGYGADTDSILAELGLDDDAVLGLRVSGAIW